MNPENQAWHQLREHAAAQLSLNFPDRVLRAARLAREAAPSLLSHFALSAATAAVCFGVVTFFNARSTRAEDVRSAAAWSEIAAEGEELAGL